MAASAARIADRPDARAQGVVRAPSILGPFTIVPIGEIRPEVGPAHRFVARPISASGPASPKLLGERRGEQGVARGVPPLGIFPADLDARFPDHLLHRFQSSNARRASYFGAESPGGAFGRTAGDTLPCGGDTEGSRGVSDHEI